MPAESIFHKLVKHEPSYTQLLCNILRRDEKFRNDFFGMEGINLIATVMPEHIYVEEHLGEHGRADIWIRSTDVAMIVEVKTNLWRELEESQRLVDGREKKSYLDLLKKEAEKVEEARIVFLTPRKWLYWEETDESIRVFNRRTDCSVKASLISWEKVISILPDPGQDSSTISITEDFQLLLSERFGPTTFKPEEIQTMFSVTFPVGVTLKLISLIYDISFELAAKKKSALKPEVAGDEYGFNIRVNDNQTHYFYVGCWLQIWEITGSPLCFGIKGGSQIEKAAITSALSSVYGQEPVADQGDWIVGFVPEQDICRSDAVSLISGKIKKVFDSIS